MNASNVTARNSRTAAPELTVAKFPAAPIATDGCGSTGPLPRSNGSALPEAELLAALRQADEVDGKTVIHLERRLRNEGEPQRLWCLLCCLELAPRHRQSIELRFNALRRLAQASEATLRFSAYRWLADLHRWDLCYETRARLAVSKGLNRETGPLQQRVKKLLRTC